MQVQVARQRRQCLCFMLRADAFRFRLCPQHDAQLDFYGRRLATCSSDRTIKVFDVVDGQASKSGTGQTLKGYVERSLVRESPVG